ncbi:DUF5345 family protein [Paenibacillus albiflavus]|uniref:DUF5345 family protein n=1 Tax=Paenibacillus albiflavus TaxID=2545760 RepID=UPI001F432974|nr:DUF5345 family protein [Paenibacillus albiflavus]
MRTDREQHQDDYDVEDEQLIDQMKLGMQAIDDAHDVLHTKPDLFQFQSLISEHKAIARRKRQMELFLFVVVAVVLVTGSLLMAYSNLTMFVILQLAVILFAAVLLTLSQLNAKDRRRANDNC